MPPNFYFLQQDYVAAEAGPWSWTVSRPSIVSDFTPGRGRNLSSLIPAYALISRHLGLPLRFPGSEQAYGAITECTDAAYLARAIAWIATAPGLANRAVNVTNGDCYRWRHLWPRFAAAFGLSMAPPQRIRLSEFMADKAPVWDAIVDAHGLEPMPLSAMAQWAYGDFVFGTEHDVLMNTTRLRQSGFHDMIDSEAMFLGHFDRYRAARLIP
jgi:nucleoside-diphosphate-sugar epimerase